MNVSQTPLPHISKIAIGPPQRSNDHSIELSHAIPHGTYQKYTGEVSKHEKLNE